MAAGLFGPAAFVRSLGGATCGEALANQEGAKVPRFGDYQRWRLAFVFFAGLKKMRRQARNALSRRRLVSDWALKSQSPGM